MQTAATPDTPASPAGLEVTLGDLRRLIEQERFGDALARADVLLGSAPEHRDLLYMRAVCLRHLKRLPEALAT